MNTHEQAHTSLILRPLVAAVAMAVASQAYAQQANAEKLEVEKVVVTAAKRSQDLQDVPAAITVLNDATLQRANVRDMDDLPALSPAVTISYSNQPGNFSINMRGIGTYSLGVGVESDVSVIIDDIPIAMQAGAFKDLADVFRVEVLKGPQSTLFGKSAIAGALNITTKPLGGPLKTTASAYLTNDNEYRLGATVAGSVNEQFRMRLAASSTNWDGNVNNLTTGNKINGSRSKSLVGKFEWAPTDDLTFTLSPYYNKTDKYCCQSVFAYMTSGGMYKNIAQLPASQALAGITPGPDNVSVRNDSPVGGAFFSYGSGLRAQYVFPGSSPLAGHTLTGIASYGKYHMDDYNDGDNTDSDVLQYLKGIDGKPTGMHGGLYQQGYFNTRARTTEVRLTSPDKGAFRYVVGFWYGSNWLERELNRLPSTSYTTSYRAQAWNKSTALFGQSTWDFMPDTSLITGVRFNREVTGYNFFRYASPPLAKVQTDYFTDSDTASDVTGKLGLERRWNKNIMTYGLMSTGHKGVAYDLTSTFDANVAKTQPVPAETARNFELGAKMSLLDNRAVLNVALFKTNFKGFQQSAGFIDPDGVFRTVLHSIGELQTRGLELDGGVRLTRAFQLNGSFAYTEATVVEFENGPCYFPMNAAGTGTTPGLGCAKNPKYNNTNVADLAGKTLPNAPKYKASLNGQYDIPLAGKSFDVYVAGTYRWQSATQFGLNQDPATIQGAYGIFNLSGGVRAKNGGYRVTAFINNVFNKSYANGLGHSGADGNWNTAAPNTPRAIETVSWIPPRDYKRYIGVRLDVTF